MSLITKVLFLAVLLHLGSPSFAQAPDSTTDVSHFSSAVSLTNNGISLVPTFSLGKPAVIFNLSVGTERISFEPDLRISLEGKPWAFVFWWRYKILKKNRFRLSAGAHPALNFITQTFLINGEPTEKIVAQRFVAGEVVPSYSISKNISIGMYYLHGRGLQADATRRLHFLTLNSSISNIPLTDQFFMQFNPQFFYLKMDKKDGFYFTSTVTLSKRNFPFSLQSIINKNIQTNIAGSKDLVWNATLIYYFNKEYVPRRQTAL